MNNNQAVILYIKDEFKILKKKLARIICCYQHSMFFYYKITDVDRKRNGTQHSQTGPVARLFTRLLRAAAAARRRRKGQTERHPTLEGKGKEQVRYAPPPLSLQKFFLHLRHKPLESSPLALSDTKHTHTRV